MLHPPEPARGLCRPKRADFVDLLRAPPVAGDVVALADLWEIDVLRIVARVPEGLEDFPELSVRVRGAFGRALHDRGGDADKGKRLTPWAALATPLLSGRDEMPKPVVVRAHVDAGLLQCELRMIGYAAAWFDEAADALIQALENGIALVADGRLQVAVEILEARRERLGAPFWSETATVANLRFRTPFAVRVGSELSNDPRGVLRSCVRRVRTLSPWLGVALQRDEGALAAAIADARLDESEIVRFDGRRHSVRQGDTPIPMRGFLGALRVSGKLGAIAPYLALASTMNAGSQAAVGLGWFDLAMA